MTIPNIGPGERRRRMGLGVLSAVVGLGALAAMMAAGVPRAWRLLLFLPFLGATSGVLQARDKT